MKNKKKFILVKNTFFGFMSTGLTFKASFASVAARLAASKGHTIIYLYDETSSSVSFFVGGVDIVDSTEKFKEMSGKMTCKAPWVVYQRKINNVVVSNEK